MSTRYRTEEENEKQEKLLLSGQYLLVAYNCQNVSINLSQIDSSCLIYVAKGRFKPKGPLLFGCSLYRSGYLNLAI